MKLAIVVFPGTSCERDLLYAVKEALGKEADLVWYENSNLANYDGIFLPGGSSYGDYLRPGAIAAKAEIMEQVNGQAEKGKPILGVGNGFQILTEAGLLPGAFQRNKNLSFVFRQEQLVIENNETMFTSQYEKGEIIRIPVAHREGNYYCDEETLLELQRNDQIVFTYKVNPNGSVANIAGIVNRRGNVLGMMPHPERAVDKWLGSRDGVRLFQSILENWRMAYVTN